MKTHLYIFNSFENKRQRRPDIPSSVHNYSSNGPTCNPEQYLIEDDIRVVLLVVGGPEALCGYNPDKIFVMAKVFHLDVLDRIEIMKQTISNG